ncbi:DUF4031 domain-containing protein [Ochrobactrum quorumnocens]|uniref:DUF4031 domain-containing protein n=1 Tax=Ochrobactrum quorumnocens TaxID=271865 RepID=A0A5N1K239_9HYPH|nr:DUF4031 domain-containing protein [[Ochrobactrum] quorumnocens]KAA9369580.1 DUF4031 domain-containing protein [[Ochrobactrum] quorumnocens]
MSVYVDNMASSFGRLILCHMWADTLNELVEMADIIGVKRKWIQGHETLSLPQYRSASWVHFDISKAKRKLAIENGALETDRYGPVVHNANLLMNSEKPDIVAKGKKRLYMVEKCRERRTKDKRSWQLNLDLFITH